MLPLLNLHSPKGQYHQPALTACEKEGQSRPPVAATLFKSMFLNVYDVQKIINFYSIFVMNVYGKKYLFGQMVPNIL